MARIPFLAAAAVLFSLDAGAVKAAQKPEPVLTCQAVRARTQQFLENHYSYKTFDNELSSRTFKKLFEAFDPGKYFFVAKDIEQFKSIEQQVDDLVWKSDCKFALDIQNVFLKRVAERKPYIMGLLDKPMSFDVDEEIVVDRTKAKWATDEAELNEQWRKRIKFQVLSMKEGLGTEAKAREKLKKRFDQMFKKYEEQDSDEALGSLVNSFALSLDPHSYYFLPVAQEEFNVRLGNSLEGIGATLSESNGYVTIEALVPGGPASRDGRLKPGDKIIGVDPGDGSGMTDVIDMELSKAVRLIRGKKATTVKLLVLRKNDKGESVRMNYSIVRDVVKLVDSEAKSDVTTVRGKKIGVINLPSFYSDFSCRGQFRAECNGGASGHVLREIGKLQAKQVDGIILDLRSNGGGDLQESIRLSGLFFPEGTVVQTVDRRRQTRPFPDTSPSTEYRGPLVVLINKQSASASEIVSGALKDYSRAIIVGDSHTFGKGTVQVVQDVPGTSSRQSDGAIKVTQAKFYLPSGRSNQEKGVESDVIIPSILDADDFGEKENDYVLPWDSIRPAQDFKALNDFTSVIPQLTSRSQARVTKDKDFIELAQNIEKFKKEKHKGTSSLKEGKVVDKTITGKNGKNGKNGKKKMNPDEEMSEEERRKMREEAKLVINKKDIQLREATNILVDAIEITKRKDWVAGFSTAAQNHSSSEKPN